MIRASVLTWFRALRPLRWHAAVDEMSALIAVKEDSDQDKDKD